MKYLTSLLLVTTLVIAGCASNTTTDATSVGATDQVTTTENTASEAKQSVEDLIASGKPMECTMDIDSETAGIQAWTMFVDGEKRIRGNYTARIDGQKIDGGIVRDGEFAYNWGASNDGQVFGTKIDLDAVNELINENANINTSEEMAELDLSETYDMDCKPWNVDASVFTPPSDITFTDLSAQLEMMQAEMPGELKAQACSACDSAPDETSKQQCKAALGC